jgi:hypothetical protein
VQVDPIAAITRSVLYEGYILWPYRRSALKNQRRWTFGGVYPRAYSEANHADDAWLMRTECLLEVGAEPEVEVSVRFLHVVDRQIAQCIDGEMVPVDAVTVDGVTHAAWQEATEREVRIPPLRVRGQRRSTPAGAPIDIEAGESHESLADADRPVGSIIRRWEAITGAVAVSIEPVDRRVYKIRVDVTNGSAWSGEQRQDVLRRTMVSTHVVLTARDAGFVSITDPPASLRELAAACTNIGTWPVLVGSPPTRDTMLSSPIILPDYPEVAPQSSGDFFDGGEIDQLLVLSVLAMTDQEQQQMRATDPRAREILDRCQSLSVENIRALHGLNRELRRDGSVV